MSLGSGRFTGLRGYCGASNFTADLYTLVLTEPPKCSMKPRSVVGWQKEGMMSLDNFVSPSRVHGASNGKELETATSTSCEPYYRSSPLRNLNQIPCEVFILKPVGLLRSKSMDFGLFSI